MIARLVIIAVARGLFLLLPLVLNHVAPPAAPAAGRSTETTEARFSDEVRSPGESRLGCSARLATRAKPGRESRLGADSGGASSVGLAGEADPFVTAFDGAADHVARRSWPAHAGGHGAPVFEAASVQVARGRWARMHSTSDDDERSDLYDVDIRRAKALPCRDDARFEIAGIAAAGFVFSTHAAPAAAPAASAPPSRSPRGTATPHPRSSASAQARGSATPQPRARSQRSRAGSGPRRPSTRAAGGAKSVAAGAAGAAGVAAVAALARDGSSWTETVTGLQTVNPTGRFKISTRGAVIVRGVPQTGIRYSILKRVKAKTESEARRLMEQYQVRAMREGDITLLRIAHAGEDGQTAELRLTVPRTLKEMVVETHGGSVDAYDLEGAVRAETGGGRMTLDRIGGRLVALTAGGAISLGSIRGSIACTSAGGAIHAQSIGGGAVVETGGGEISVGEVRGPVRASTAGGGIRIKLAGGSVDAMTAGGAIEVGQARGTVTANNLGGPIEIGTAEGVSCETAGGAIRLNNVWGSLRATTAVGSIYAHLARGKTLRDSMLSTAAGDITVLVPEGFPLTIHAENGSADSVRRIHSDFPGIRIRTAGPLAVAEGKIHGGGPILKLTGTGGTIRIVKQDKQED